MCCFIVLNSPLLFFLLSNFPFLSQIILQPMSLSFVFLSHLHTIQLFVHFVFHIKPCVLLPNHFEAITTVPNSYSSSGLFFRSLMALLALSSPPRFTLSSGSDLCLSVCITIMGPPVIGACIMAGPLGGDTTPSSMESNLKNCGSEWEVKQTVLVHLGRKKNILT